MIHIAHTKTAMWRKWSACRKLISRNSTLRNALAPFSVPYEMCESEEQILVSGFEPYQHDHQTRDGGFVFIPALWLDVMRYFVLQHDNLRDLSEVFTQVFSHIPATKLHTSEGKIQSKFHNEYRCLWLGDERDSNVMGMLCDCNKAHTFGMARCRVFNKKINIHRNGKRWILPQTGLKNPKYDDLSFAYGVQCWEEQLRMLNTCYAYFTDQPLTEKPFHLHGLIVKDLETPVLSREQCRRNGIFQDKEKSGVSQATRSQRYKLGAAFAVNFWGCQSQVTYYYKKK